MARKFKTGGVSQCFHCGRQLVRQPGAFLFAEAFDPLGNTVRVHHQCLKKLLAEQPEYKDATVKRSFPDGPDSPDSPAYVAAQKVAAVNRKWFGK